MPFFRTARIIAITEKGKHFFRTMKQKNMFLCIVAVGKGEQKRIIRINSEKCKAFQLFRFLVFLNFMPKKMRKKFTLF